jgi:hypothetical protein
MHCMHSPGSSRPTQRDRLVVLLQSLGLGGLLTWLLLGGLSHLHTGWQPGMVLLLVVWLPVVLLNALLPYSRWPVRATSTSRPESSPSSVRAQEEQHLPLIERDQL